MRFWLKTSSQNLFPQVSTSPVWRKRLGEFFFTIILSIGQRLNLLQLTFFLAFSSRAIIWTVTRNADNKAILIFFGMIKQSITFVGSSREREAESICSNIPGIIPNKPDALPILGRYGLPLADPRWTRNHNFLPRRLSAGIMLPLLGPPKPAINSVTNILAKTRTPVSSAPRHVTLGQVLLDPLYSATVQDPQATCRILSSKARASIIGVKSFNFGAISTLTYVREGRGSDGIFSVSKLPTQFCCEKSAAVNGNAARALQNNMSDAAIYITFMHRQCVCPL